MPIKNEYKYDGVLVERFGKYYRLKKYTTYLREGGLIYAYKKHAIDRYSDDIVYETAIERDYKVVKDTPFLSEDQLLEMMSSSTKEKQPLKDRIKELTNEIGVLSSEIEEIDKKYDIENKCEHRWEKNGEEEYNEGRSTKRFYVCSICGKEDIQHWHSVF
jgi:rubrerythrin